MGILISSEKVYTFFIVYKNNSVILIIEQTKEIEIIQEQPEEQPEEQPVQQPEENSEE